MSQSTQDTVGEDSVLRLACEWQRPVQPRPSVRAPANKALAADWRFWLALKASLVGNR